MQEHIDRINEICEESRKTTDAAEKDRLKRAFFAAAIDAFNDEIAGDVTLADGRILHTPKIEI